MYKNILYVIILIISNLLWYLVGYRKGARKGIDYCFDRFEKDYSFLFKKDDEE